MRSLHRARTTYTAPLIGIVLASTSACTTDTPVGTPPPVTVVPANCDGLSNPLDHAVCAEFYAADYKPLIAGDDELCSRLFIDMTGVRASADRIANECAGKPAINVISQLQISDEYRRQMRRRWADRFSYSDAMVDALSIKELDRLVEDLYQEKITYKQFVIEAASHPGFVGRHNGYGQPDLTANAAFKAFLNRPATRPEMRDLANLWRPWITGFGVIDDVQDRANYGYGSAPMVDPQACAAGKASCESLLLGYSKLEFPGAGLRTEGIRLVDLTPEQWDALRAPGKLFVTLDAVWEAQVDEALERYLGYDLGELRPRVRQALVDHFKRNDGNVVELERTILSSWVYRQTAKEVAGKERPEALRGSPIAYGPTKLMHAETWLHSIGAAIGRDIGECDWRYPNLPDFGGSPEVRELIGDYYPNDATGAIDLTFRTLARSVGGCPGAFDFGSFSISERSTNIGLITAVAQEEALINLCFVGDTPALFPSGLELSDKSDASLRETARHVLQRATGSVSESALDEAVELYESGCPNCDVESVARGLCSGLLGGIEFMTY